MARTQEATKKVTKKPATKKPAAKKSSEKSLVLTGRILGAFNAQGEKIGNNGVVSGDGTVTKIVKTEHKYKNRDGSYYRYRLVGKSVDDYTNKDGKQVQRNMSWPVSFEKATKYSNEHGIPITTGEVKKKTAPKKRTAKACERKLKSCESALEKTKAKKKTTKKTEKPKKPKKKAASKKEE